MLPENQVLSAIIIFNKFELMPKVNPIWFKDNVNRELWKNLVLCFSEYKKLDTEILKTWIFETKNKLEKVLIERVNGLNEIYPPDDVVENLQEYYVNNCLTEYMNMHVNKNATVDAKRQLFNEVYKKINTNIDLDESKSLEENINEYIKNVYNDEVSNRFNDNSIKLTDENLINIFGHYLRPFPIVIGGNPGYFKTSLMLNILKDIDLQKKNGLIFSFEDTIDTLRNKYIAIKTGIPIDNIVNNTYNDIEKQILTKSIKQSKRVWIYEKPCNVLKFRQIVDKHVITYDIKYILIDYFQLFYGLKGLSKVEGLEMIAKELVNIRKDYEIPIIVLSQLTTEDGSDAGLNDLKWCKALGESARQVFLLCDGKEEGSITLKCVKNTFYGTFNKQIYFNKKSCQLVGSYEEC